MSIILDTPAQINMWVLLSRRSQLKLQMEGLKVPGIVKWCQNNIPGCETQRTAKACLVVLNDYIGELDGPEDPDVNYNVFMSASVEPSLYFDFGVFSTMEELIDEFGTAYSQGRVHIFRTFDEPRPGDRNISPIYVTE